MRVDNCPSCGSGDISKSSSSFEYGGSTRWSCGSCGWRYKRGRGIGTGTGNSGTHPRDAGPSSGQGTLTQTAEWCHRCETCALPGRCRCVEEGQTAACETCYNYSTWLSHDKIDLRYGTDAVCQICEDEQAEYKIIEEA